MEITGNVHLFFEQSGTFKNEFKKLGYDAYDYDIQNNFGETNHLIDFSDTRSDIHDGWIREKWSKCEYADEKEAILAAVNRIIEVGWLNE